MTEYQEAPQCPKCEWSAPNYGILGNTVNWKCRNHQCGHEWKDQIGNFTYSMEEENETRCPFCREKIYTGDYLDNDDEMNCDECGSLLSIQIEYSRSLELNVVVPGSKL